MTARDAVLGSIRAALADVPAAERAEDVPIARDYRRTDGQDPAQIIERFDERVADYKATVHRIPPDAIGKAVTEACVRRGVRSLVVPPELPEAWRPDGVELVVDENLSSEALDGIDGVLTGCAVGIAETGTIVLDAGPAQGRRAITLVPDYHLCVVDAAQVVGSVPEAIAALRGAVDARRPLTFISGPSATSDIELSRVEGVHGPRTLEVLIVG